MRRCMQAFHLTAEGAFGKWSDRPLATTSPTWPVSFCLSASDLFGCNPTRNRRRTGQICQSKAIQGGEVAVFKCYKVGEIY